MASVSRRTVSAIVAIPGQVTIICSASALLSWTGIAVAYLDGFHWRFDCGGSSESDGRAEKEDVDLHDLSLGGRLVWMKLASGC